MGEKKEIFKLIIKEFQERKLPEIKTRNLILPQNNNKIITISGPRRVGKTYYFYQIIENLRKKIPFEEIIYINFEDDRLFPLEVKDLDDLLEGYFELYPKNKGKRIYCFFDEIQNVKNWEIFIRRIYDKENLKIFITGSSSKLLSREIATCLRGRTLNYHLFPLSFKEFLRFKGVELEKNFAYSKIRFEVKKLFQEYVIFGGFPELVLEKEELKQAILKNYYDLVVYRDLVERFAIRNLAFLRFLIKYLLTNLATYFSVHSFWKSLEKSFKVSRETILEYLSYLEEIELIFLAPIFSFSFKVQQINPKKIYAIDNGLRNTIAFRFSEDFGRLLENLVFVELKRRGREVFYHKQKRECDFIVRENLKTQAIQVTQILDNKNKKREIDGLIEAMEKWKIEEGIVLTLDQEEEIRVNIKNKKTKIKVLPLWKWLLW